MAPITQNKVAAGHAIPNSSLVAGTTIALVGIAMAFLAVPHFVAGLIQIGGDPTAAAIERSLPTTPDGLDADIESREAALGWYNIPQYHDQIGFAEVRNYLRLDTLPAKPVDAEKAAQQKAIDEFTYALALQPADPYAWQQLALTDVMLSGPSARVARYLRMSIETGPEEPNLVVERLAVAMTNWAKLDFLTRAMFIRQVENAAAYRTRELADLALRFGAGDFVKSILASRPDLQARFAEMYFEPEEGSPLFRVAAPPVEPQNVGRDTKGTAPDKAAAADVAKP
jgi:hypothetical protein